MKEKVRLIDKIRERLKLMLSLDYSPKKTALASALGILVGISPYIGLQTYIALALSTIFKLPVYPLIAGVYLTNPITIPIIFALTTKFGFWMLGREFNIDFAWDDVTITSLLEAGKAIFIPFMLGTHMTGIILSIPTYFIVYYIMKYSRRKKKLYPDKEKLISLESTDENIKK